MPPVACGQPKRTFKALGQQAKSVISSRYQLNHGTAPTSDDKHVSAKWIFGQCRGQFRCQAVKAGRRVGRTGGKPNAGFYWRA